MTRLELKTEGTGPTPRVLHVVRGPHRMTIPWAWVVRQQATKPGITVAEAVDLWEHRGRLAQVYKILKAQGGRDAGGGRAR